MERLKAMKNTLMSCVEGQLGKLEETDTKELGEAIDMIKDLEEAMYYCSIVKAMEKTEKEEETMEKLGLRKSDMSRYYTPMMYYPYERDMDRDMGRMYYSDRQPRNMQGEFTSYYGGNSGGGNSSSMGGSSMSSGTGRGYYTEHPMPFEFRDMREGRSPMSRRSYIESKEMHKDKDTKMKELEKYMQELGDDIIDMIKGASPEEKQILDKKLATLASKVSQINV